MRAGRLWGFDMYRAMGELGGQAGVALGERFKAAWEWVAVLGQVELYGWDKVDLRFEMRFGRERGVNS